MFNLSGFNHNRFNTPETIAAVRLRTNAYETVDGLFGIAQNVLLATNAAEQLNGTMNMLQGTLLQLSAIDAAEAFEATVSLVATSNQTANASEQVGGRMRLGSNVYQSHGLVEELQARPLLGANVYLRSISEEELVAVVNLGANVFSAADLYEIWAAVSEVENHDIRSVIIDVTLKPGDVLVLDSDNYTVLHNGENIIHKHSGDWVHLSRNTRHIQVDAGNAGSLASSILYTERYL